MHNCGVDHKPLQSDPVDVPERRVLELSKDEIISLNMRILEDWPRCAAHASRPSLFRVINFPLPAIPLVGLAVGFTYTSFVDSHAKKYEETELGRTWVHVQAHIPQETW